ncbi:cupin domain-containing protein [Burkholderia sp. Ac-20379]|uniref:cupin domain-containing protein n=1 Tax=Burkholderia sp. Ac-20379 TaxID=2703900 RepID=UPI00197D2BC5|nr:cupin domain-containing protein [Burkholderia sp. Ac-20379]MBN3724773.1 cupin domain-containing protein [Burkholderia sp. Ac-20379]
MTLNKVNVAAGFAAIGEYWSPRIGGDINDSQIKFAKFSGTFNWHHHDHEDELFFVVKGTLRMKLRAEHGGDVLIEAGEYLIVPKGTEHCPEAVTDEVHCLLLEPKTTVNTGNVVNERTRTHLERI